MRKASKKDHKKKSTTTTTTTTTNRVSRPNNKSNGHNQASSSETPNPPSPTTTTATALRLDLGLDLGGSLTKVCFFEPYNVPENGKKFAAFISESTTYGRTGVRDQRLSFESKRLGGKFHFIYFQTSRTQGAIDLMKSVSGATSKNRFEVHATGGGAIKFAKLVEQELGMKLIPEDELETVISGIVFVLLEQPHTCYSIEPKSLETVLDGNEPTYIRVPRPVNMTDLFPLLVVNIGSGVSIIKVDDPNNMRRISGTAVGGGTFYGLCKLLTRCETFEEAMDMADRGDSRRVNMLVSDIYGGSYDRVGLPGSITASFFGKAASVGRARPASSGSHEDVLLARRERSGPWWVRWLRWTAPGHIPVSVLLGVIVCDQLGVKFGWIYFVGSVLATCLVLMALHIRRQRRHNRAAVMSAQQTQQEDIFQDEDIARALVTMVAQNITQIAYLNAKLHHTKRIVFTGNFLRHNPIALRTLTSNLKLFSGNEVEALFMEHEGFFGAIGAFLASDTTKEKLRQAEGNGVVMPRTSSFHAPEEGDDVFHLASPQVSAATRKEVLKKEEHSFPVQRSVVDVMAELRLT